ncbi:MAG: hypothetical protein HYV33_06240 [Candidatus Kerfeldbacteria bacterium]|nr:hypothetical protein [Candidatus Kerfeldbacteria bacterium]
MKNKSQLIDNIMWWQRFEGRDPLPYEDRWFYIKTTMTLEKLRKYSFHSGEKHLSQRIDEIVYGIKR